MAVEAPLWTLVSAADESPWEPPMTGTAREILVLGHRIGDLLDRIFPDHLDQLFPSRVIFSEVTVTFQAYFFLGFLHQQLPAFLGVVDSGTKRAADFLGVFDQLLPTLEIGGHRLDCPTEVRGDSLSDVNNKFRGKLWPQFFDNIILSVESTDRSVPEIQSPPISQAPEPRELLAPAFELTSPSNRTTLISKPG